MRTDLRSSRAGERGAGVCAERAVGAADRPRRRADGLHRLLGRCRDRRLALADDDAAERRRLEHSGDRRRTDGRRSLGSGERHRGRRTMPRVRRGGHHAHAGAPAHHLAGRQHAEDRHRQRHADAAAAFQRERRAAVRAGVAGVLAREVGVGRRRTRPGAVRRRPSRRAERARRKP